MLHGSKIPLESGAHARKIKWALILFFGWLLSFPLQGPILYSLATAQDFDGNQFGLVFIFFHASGLFLAGLFFSKSIYKQPLLLGSSSLCFLGSLAFLTATPGLWTFLLAALGILSGFYVIGWTHFYIVCVYSNRIRFMAEVIIGANLIYYIINLLSSFTTVGSKLLLATLTVPLLIVVWLSSSFYPTDSIARVKHPQVKKFPARLVMILSLFVLGLYINGGIMYSIIFPSFLSFAHISRIYRVLPYLTILFGALFIRKNRNKIGLFYLGIVLLGLGFVSYIAFKGSLVGYFLTETFILSSLALLDLGLWTLSADIGEVYGHIAGIFGLTLSANVMALHIGGLIGNKMIATGDPYVNTGLIAFFSIFLTLALIPGLGNLISRYLVKRKEEILASQESSELILAELTRQSSENFTPREEEIIGLILRGCGNLEIAGRLEISENTVKVHVKNINKKLGILNKNELLSLAVKILIGLKITRNIREVNDIY